MGRKLADSVAELVAAAEGSVVAAVAVAECVADASAATVAGMGVGFGTIVACGLCYGASRPRSAKTSIITKQINGYEFRQVILYAKGATVTQTVTTRSQSLESQSGAA